MLLIRSAPEQRAVQAGSGTSTDWSCCKSSCPPVLTPPADPEPVASWMPLCLHHRLEFCVPRSLPGQELWLNL